MFKIAKTSFVLATGMAFFSLPALGAEIEVKMLNKGSDGQAMVFEPAAIKAAPGDVIKFVPVDKGHNAAAVKGMLPDGAEEFTGKMTQELALTADKEGADPEKCTTPRGMGRCTMTVVDDAPPANLEA